MSTGSTITRVRGALVQARPMPQASLYELVRIGARGLLGEVVRIEHDTATIQVFENTIGLALGEPVEPTGAPLSATLGPGLLGSVLDGVGRNLHALAEREGHFIVPGTRAPSVDPTRRWRFEATATVGATLAGGDVLGWVEEPSGFRHWILAPPDRSGTLAALDPGEFSVDEPVGRLADGTPLALAHTWPVRRPRPRAASLRGDRAFVTGQRVLDLLFPVAEGGAVALPGGFGTGKTIIEQSLAKHADADIVIYVGCGERGNEMADVLDEFPRLTDPRTGGPLLARTVLVVNTSNMPVAAREASVYLGMTYAEYFRDMGYRVAMLADSLSRWAEAMREVSSLLEEMPGEEGYPTTLGNRLGHLYERAGRVQAIGTPERTGAVTLISALSPPGSDFSEPVTQASLRAVAALWALDPALAHARQFPAVDCRTSYSLDAASLDEWLGAQVGGDWSSLRHDVLALLQRDEELREVVGLVGPEALDDQDRLALESATLVRDVVLGQSAFDRADACSSLAKTYLLAHLVMELHRSGVAAIESGRTFASLNLRTARRTLAQVRNADDDTLSARVDEARGALRAVVEPPR